MRFGLFSACIMQNMIAQRTPAVNCVADRLLHFIRGKQLELRNNGPQLFKGIVFFQQQEIFYAPDFDKARIPGQEHPVLFFCYSQDMTVFDLGII